MGNQGYFSELDNTGVSARIIHAFFVGSAHIFTFFAFVYVFAFLGVKIFFKTRWTDFFRYLIDAREIAFGIQASLGFAIAIVLGRDAFVNVFKFQVELNIN